jgi:hypothetical protein
MSILIDVNKTGFEARSNSVRLGSLHGACLETWGSSDWFKLV